ncbi:MAG: hypothetical protein GF393_05165 [Armatimonadia bacterium]|nr:hypothetical protein [Armatimonadia bacterium]
MARSQMLYVGKQGAVSYPAAGNIEMNAGSSGTLALWYHPMNKDQRCNLVVAAVDADNHLLLSRSQENWKWRSRRNGTAHTVFTPSDAVAWRFVVATWDFTGGSGVLRLFLDGEEVPESPLTGASAPDGIPQEITIGPGVSNPYGAAHAAFDHLAIWDGAMSAQQVEDLYAKGRHNHPEAADCIGDLLMLASWDEQFDATVAAGSATATLLGTADQYCRLDCRSRHQGKRFEYGLGMPAHDGSPDDRVPVAAVLSPRGGQPTLTNLDDHSRAEVSADGEVHPAGIGLAPWLQQPVGATTLKVGLHVDSTDAPNGAPIAVGAQDYVTGKAEALIAGSGCTTSTIVAAGLDQPDDYWAGAELHVLTGSQRGQKMKVASSSQSGTSVTIDGQLGEAPAVGDRLIVIEPWRVEPPCPDGELYRLECDLGETHSGVPRFAELETASIGSAGYTRYNAGRIQYYPMDLTGEEIFFGKRDDGVIYDHFSCTLLLDRVEMHGPTTYEVTEAADDSFMVWDPETGESTKVWRTEHLEREVRRPEQHPNPTAVQDAMVEPGTWRDTLKICPRSMAYDAENERLTAVLVGIDPEGVKRAGHIHGTWNEAQGLVEWTDDPDPRNPFLVLDELDAALGGDSDVVGLLAAVGNTYEIEEGNWALQFTAGIGNPDGVLTCAMEGAPDRYSFDPKVHFDETINPLTPTLSGDDKMVPEGSGTGLFGNRDCEILFTENPWAAKKSDRFWGCGRAKTINQHGWQMDYAPQRPLTCAVTGDFRNVRHVPWPNQVVAPARAEFHWPHPQWYYPSTVGVIVDDGTSTSSDVGLWVSEDGVHFMRLMAVAVRNTPPLYGPRMMPLSSAPRIGDRRVYWYRGVMGGTNFSMASTRLGGEAVYCLVAGELEGMLETCSLGRREEHWHDLRLNADPGGGSVSVAVLNAETGAVVPGYDHSDCDAVTDAVEGRVTWNGVGLPEVTDESVRLEFRLTRPDTGAQSPELYEWMIGAPLVAHEPTVAAVQVEGKMNPVSVANPQPELTWTYDDPLGHPQSAYQVLVASTQEKLDADEGDLWDSGVVLSDEPTAKYAGVELASERMYFWKVRVRNSEGVWSEEW